MPVNISNALLKRHAANPPEKIKDLRDSDVTGYVVRVQPSGSISHYCQFKRGKRVKLGSWPVVSMSEARATARAALSRYQLEGVVPVKKQIPTLREFVATTYASWCENNLKCPKSQVNRIKTNFGHLKNKPLDEISRSDIDAVRQKMLGRGVTPVSVNRTVNSISSVLTRALELDLIERHPLRGFKPLPTIKGGKQRILSDAERSRFLDVVNNYDATLYTRPLVLTLYYCGLRLGECASLEWRDLDFENRMLTIRGENNKTSTEREVPISNELLPALRDWQMVSGRRDGYVFPSPTGRKLVDIHVAWKSICRKADLTNLTIRNLRSIFVSRLVRANVHPYVAAKIAGHSQATAARLRTHSQ